MRSTAPSLCVDAIGDPADPAVVLIMGGGGSMDRWEEPFCERLAAAGRYVIRYDHRDTGGSTTSPPGEPAYTADDLVADPLAILDRLGIARAHFVGLSMGGGIVQRIAVEHPERVLSVTLMSTSPAGTGGPELPPMSDALQAVETPAEPDWSDRDAAVAFLLEQERPYAGSRGFDDEAVRRAARPRLRALAEPRRARATTSSSTAVTSRTRAWARSPRRRS